MEQGALRWTLYGAVACAVGHLTWPFFRYEFESTSGVGELLMCGRRRQTWALKGFITSSGEFNLILIKQKGMDIGLRKIASVAGVVIGAGKSSCSVQPFARLNNGCLNPNSISTQSNLYINILTPIPSILHTLLCSDQNPANHITIARTDDYLLKHEHTVRRSENSLRRQARNELAREGKIATESEIRKWKVAKTERDAESGKEKEGLVRREIERMDMEKRETEVRGAAEGRGVEQRQVERGTDNQKEADALGNRVEDMTRIEPEARGIPDEHP